MRGRMCNNNQDCIRACIATLTDDDNVPHVFDGRPPEESWAALRAYLASVGKKLALFTMDDINDMAENNPDIPYMLMGTTKYSDENHAVVGMNGKVVFNPSWAGREMLKHKDFNCWIVAVVL